ncbi:MAG: hypothetical protein GXO65_00680 [Euryarchaeota archaeon]|nr:hypothetical protein [Euryarchaeota archaeon]
MTDIITIRIALNLLSAPFGFTAMYYGYKGYSTTKGGLGAYKYFFYAMTGLGAAVLFDLLDLVGKKWPGAVGGYGQYCHPLMQIALVAVAFFMLIAFIDVYKFVSNAFKVE